MVNSSVSVYVPAAIGKANGFGMCWGGWGKLRVRSAKSTLLPELAEVAVFCKEEGVGTGN